MWTGRHGVLIKTAAAVHVSRPPSFGFHRGGVPMNIVSLYVLKKTLNELVDAPRSCVTEELTAANSAALLAAPRLRVDNMYPQPGLVL